MKKGEIWLVNFDPSVGNEYQKVRPTLILQSDDINSSLLTVMPLSSKTNNPQKDDIFILKNDKNRLFSDSILKVQQISSFDKKRFIHFVGNFLDQNSEVKNYLIKHFGI